MSGPLYDHNIAAVEFRASDDAAALTELAAWLRDTDRRLDVSVIKITHDYDDQYLPVTLVAYVMLDE